MDKLLKDFEPLFKKYIDDVDLSPMMCFMIDVVHPDALPYLAKQFNVDGFRGWDLATTETARRELIKTAIQLQKKVGTPWAIKNALKAIGFPNVTINERMGIYYDGAYIYDGSQIHSSSTWVNFGVVIKVVDPNAITNEQKDLIRILIDEYKPARCVLVSLTFQTL